MQATRNAFVSCADTWIGVYAARALLQSGKYSKVNAAVFSTHSEFARTLEKEGANLLEWDVSNVNGLTQLMEGNDCCCLIPVPNTGLQEFTENIITACERANIKDSVLWSMMEVEMPSPSPSFEETKLMAENPIQRGKEIMKMLQNVEQKYSSSSMSNKVILRLALPIQSLFFLSDLIQDKAIIPMATGSGSFAPVNLQDVGNATSNLLSNPDYISKYRNQKFTLTGGQLINTNTLAEYASRALNTKIEYRSLNLNEMNHLLQRLVSIGEMTEFGKDVFLYRNYVIRENKAQVRTDDLKRLLENDPTTIERFFEENSQAFKPGSGPGRWEKAALLDMRK